MKTTAFFRNTVRALLFFLLLLHLSSCSFLVRTKIYQEHDIVKNSQRFRKDIYALKVDEKRTPFLNLKKSFVKETSAENGSSMVVYDHLSLSLYSFNVEPSVYMIANEIVVAFENIETTLDFSSNVSEDRQEIITADSARVSVVTGYSTHQSKLIRFSYELDSLQQEIIAKADKLAFRYYAGPSMMTVHLRQRDLKDLKKIISK